MDKARILRLCKEIEKEISEAWNCDVIEYDKAGHIISIAQKIAAEITAPPKSNADRIRQMTDEELADVIGFNECKNTAHGYECPAWIQPNCGGKCKKHFLAWLKQGVNEDETD